MFSAIVRIEFLPPFCRATRLGRRLTRAFSVSDLEPAVGRIHCLFLKFLSQPGRPNRTYYLEFEHQRKGIILLPHQQPFISRSIPASTPRTISVHFSLREAMLSSCCNRGFSIPIDALFSIVFCSFQGSSKPNFRRALSITSSRFLIPNDGVSLQMFKCGELCALRMHHPSHPIPRPNYRVPSCSWTSISAQCSRKDWARAAALASFD